MGADDYETDSEVEAESRVGSTLEGYEEDNEHEYEADKYDDDDGGGADYEVSSHVSDQAYILDYGEPKVTLTTIFTPMLFSNLLFFSPLLPLLFHFHSFSRRSRKFYPEGS